MWIKYRGKIKKNQLGLKHYHKSARFYLWLIVILPYTNVPHQPQSTPVLGWKRWPFSSIEDNDCCSTARAIVEVPFLLHYYEEFSYTNSNVMVVDSKQLLLLLPNSKYFKSCDAPFLWQVHLFISHKCFIGTCGVNASLTFHITVSMFFMHSHYVSAPAPIAQQLAPIYTYASSQIHCVYISNVLCVPEVKSRDSILKRERESWTLQYLYMFLSILW